MACRNAHIRLWYRWRRRWLTWTWLDVGVISVDAQLGDGRLTLEASLIFSTLVIGSRRSEFRVRNLHDVIGKRSVRMNSPIVVLKNQEPFQ